MVMDLRVLGGLSTSCVLHAVAGLTPRPEEACFSVWQCRLYVYCRTRLAVFSYGSLIFRSDSESSISFRVLQALVLRLHSLRAGSCFAESNEQMAPFDIVSLTRYTWFIAALTSGARAHVASTVGNLATPR